MHQRPRTLTLLAIATSMAASWLAAVVEAQSHRHHRAQGQQQRGQHLSAVSSRPAARPPVRQPRVVSPGGLSASNVRPGFYKQLNAPQHPRGRGGGYSHAVPVYVYPTYLPETFYPPAPAYREPEPREAPAPVQPQIYVVTPPVVTAPPAPAPPAPAPPPAAPPAPRSTEPGEVKFSVLPADARVDLDDDSLGTGAELASLEEASMFPPGVHVLEVKHPDYRPQRLVFGVSDSDPAHVLIDLSIDEVGRRTRIK